MVLSIPPLVGKSRVRPLPSFSSDGSTSMPALESIADSSSKVSAASIPSLSASSFFERQGPINTVLAFGYRRRMSAQWACIGVMTGARQPARAG